MLKSIINNFTHNEIQADIKPNPISGINSETKITLSSKDRKNYQHEDILYNVNVTKIDSNPVNMLFTLKFSSYMAFMCDLDNDRLYLQNFLNGNKHYDKYSNIPDEIMSNEYEYYKVRKASEQINPKNQNIKNDPNIHFETTTNTNGRKSNIVEYEIDRKSLNEFDNKEDPQNKRESFLNNLQNKKIDKKKPFVMKEFMKFDENDENDFFQAKYIKKKSLESKCSFKDMLKKNNSIKPEMLKKLAMECDNTKKRDVLPHEILITNSSICPVYLRLSGGKEQEQYIKVPSNSFRFFQRKSLSIYRLNVCCSEKTLGPIYNVKSGCEYDFDESGNVTSPCGEHLLSILHHYIPSFELENAYGILENKQDNSVRKLNSKNQIIIANKSDHSVNVIVQGNTIKEHEASIQIEPLVYIKFNRSGLTYKLTMVKKDGKNAKHEIDAGSSYEIIGDNQELIEASQGKKVQKYFTKNLKNIGGGMVKEINKCSNIPINLGKTQRFNLDKWGPKWQEFRKLLITNPNKERLKDFNNLLFRFIEIKNISSVTYFIRIIARNIGSQDFVGLETGEVHEWKRTHGEFLTEIVNFNDLCSKRYKLTADESYIIDKDGNVINQKTKENIKNIYEYFEDTENLVYFDKKQNQYISKKINYKNFDRTSSKIIKTEENEEELKYFNDIKPTYIPGQSFTDPDFPPDETSFRAVDKDGNKRPKHFVHARSGLSESQIQTLKFKRPKDVFESQYYLYKDDISIDDVKQGQIGNCYLISVLASLSQRPDLIYRVFKSRTINPDGYYELYYYENSEKKVMFIDDNVVMFNSKYLNEFQFAKPNGEELWVMLLEKAYAKYEGGYSNIIGGKMYQELNWLTGAIARQIKTDNPSCWNEIFNGCNKNYIITTSSNRGTGNHNNQTPNGIANGHAYSIIDANEYSSEAGDIRLLRMRNPWGHTEWKGNFSDDDTKNWTPELKEFFEYDKYMGNDGIFFMPFEDYIKEFSSFVICCIDSGKKQ